MPVSRNLHPWPFASSDTPDDAKLQMPLPPLLSAVARMVDVISGGNSAGQAAVFLGQTAKRVHMLVRSSGLAESMSRYLIRRIEQTPTITLRTNTEIVALEGGRHLERMHWRNNQTGAIETQDVRHLFVMTGAVPSTQ